MIVDILFEGKKAATTYECSNMKGHGNCIVLYDARELNPIEHEAPEYSTLRFNADRCIYWGRREDGSAETD